MADSEANNEGETQHTEISEVQSFGGGEIKSIEPIAESDVHVDTHGEMHHYAGGQIVERANTKLSPIYWVSAATLLAIIIFTLLYVGVIPFFHPFTGSNGYARPVLTTNTGYSNVQKMMATNATFAAMTSPVYIDMYRLPRPGDQNLPGAISAGSDVYQHYCIGCHGPNQDGAGPNAVSLNPSPRNLRNTAFIEAMSYQRAWTSVHQGVPGTAMPRWENTLNDRQIQDVICYVFSLTAPADPKTGDFIRPTPQDVSGSEPASQPGGGAALNVSP